MKKKFVILIMVGSMALLAVCGFALSKAVEYGKKELEYQMEHAGLLDDYSDDSDKSSSQADKKYQIGETVDLETENGALISLTLTDWGSEYDSFLGKTSLYVSYEIENTGDIPFTFTEGIFTIYADDYSIGSTIGKDSIAAREISAGRKVFGRTYGNIDPNKVNTLEVEVGGICVYVLKDLDGQESNNDTLSESQTGFPADITADEKPIDIDRLAGFYEGDIKATTLDIFIYSSPEEEVVGNVIMEGEYSYKGELVKLGTNFYYISDDVGDILTLSFYTDSADGTIRAVFYINQDSFEDFIQTQAYKS